MGKNTDLFQRRRLRTRATLARKGGGRPRLSVHRTLKHIYAQVIDDSRGHTLAAASSLDPQFSGQRGSNVEAASEVGRLVAERAQKAGVSDVLFDRGGFIYHGRVKALADAARDGGLNL